MTKFRDVPKAVSKRLHKKERKAVKKLPRKEQSGCIPRLSVHASLLYKSIFISQCLTKGVHGLLPRGSPKTTSYFAHVRTVSSDQSAAACAALGAVIGSTAIGFVFLSRKGLERY